ncbi:MAG: site-specific integrase [Bifidobacteriaceae bacterium]|jgi:site-specific recombinase XerD|nr:site-specific integrase [Bifidobacteriaceae bacterium]
MTGFPALVQGFFADRLIGQLGASPHTVAAYRDAVKTLICYASVQSGKQPSDLDLADLDAALIGRFLTWLETGRGNGVATRNARLTAIKALYRHASYQAPEHAHLIAQVLAIPPKRGPNPVMTYLTPEEACAVTAAPDTATRQGRRDQTLLHLAIHTGLRVAEITGLTVGDIQLGAAAHLQCRGKGRKDRIVPLTTETANLVRAWTRELPPGPDQALFPGPGGKPLSRDAVAKLLAKHTATAAETCPTITYKHVTPHTMRHTCAMMLRSAGVDMSVIAVWLGHASTASTDVYLHADMRIKQQALALVAPAGVKPGRYKPPDGIIQFLDTL